MAGRLRSWWLGCILLAVAGAADVDPPAWRTLAPADADPQSEEILAGQDRCRRAVEEATTPERRLQAHAAAANWWLAVPVARPATRWLLGLSGPADLESIHRAAAEARVHLEQCSSLLGQVGASTGKPPGEVARHLDTLRAFADLLAVATTSTATAEGTDAWNKAVRGLAVARESRDEETAAAALLWQAFGLAQSDRPARALAVLPQALEPPGALPFDYLARLLRCRILSDQGHHAAGMALLTQIRGAAGNWFKGSARRHLNSARRLAGWVALVIGRRWHAQLASDAGAAGRMEALLAETAAELAGNGGQGTAEVYSLPAAIPILVFFPRPAPATGTVPTGHDSDGQSPTFTREAGSEPPTATAETPEGPPAAAEEQAPPPDSHPVE